MTINHFIICTLLGLIFYVLRPFRIWAIVTHQNFLSFVAFSKVCLFTIPPTPHSAIHWHKFIRWGACCSLPHPFSIQCWVFSSPSSNCLYLIQSISDLFLKTSLLLTCSVHGIHDILWDNHIANTLLNKNQRIFQLSQYQSWNYYKILIQLKYVSGYWGITKFNSRINALFRMLLVFIFRLAPHQYSFHYLVIKMYFYHKLNSSDKG